MPSCATAGGLCTERVHVHGQVPIAGSCSSVGSSRCIETERRASTARDLISDVISVVVLGLTKLEREREGEGLGSQSGR